MANPAKDSKEKPSTPDDKKPPGQREDDKAAHPPAAVLAQTAPAFDIAGLSDEQLTSLIATAEEALSSRQAKKQGDFLASIREQALKLGLDPAAIAVALGKGTGGKRARSRSAGAGDARATVKPKYRNPANHGETWAGRGAQPMWVRAALKAGKKLEEFLIPDGSA